MSANIPTKEVPIRRETTALMVVDMQKEFAMPGVGLNKHMDPNNMPDRLQYLFTKPGETAVSPTLNQEKADPDQYLFSRLRHPVIPSTQQLLKAFRSKNGEVVFTRVACLTKDGRDQGLVYNMFNFLIPQGSLGAEILDEVKPEEDEIVISKTACSVFNSTNIEYILRNLGVSQLVICGLATNYCVESAVRCAADRGFLVTVVEDACAALSQPEHEAAMHNMRVFGRVCTHQQVVEEVEAWEEKKLTLET